MFKTLIALGCAVIICGNLTLILSGWLEEFDKREGKTKIYILNILLDFFPALFINPSSKLVFDIISGVALPATTAIMYEGGRRKKTFSQTLLLSYWLIAQFIAVGFATPLFCAFYLDKKQDGVKDYLQLDKVRTYTMLLGAVLLGVYTQYLLPKFQNGTVSTTELIIWLFWPVIVIPSGILLDQKKFVSIPFRPRIGQELCYIISILTSVSAQINLLELYTKKTPILTEIISNPPALFLVFDLLGVMLAMYIWLIKENRVPQVLLTLPIAVLLGPGAHIAILCIVRERELDRLIEEQQQQQRQE